MESLVIIQEEKAITTSLKIVEVFGKRHHHVLQDIRNLIEQTSDIEDAPKFGEMFYRDTYDLENQAYAMERDGFTLLAMD
ncbi:MAG: Rha family transcriptional regulator [Microscillaceae bacterium]|jgi:anti-repressor protein|nr:Rha family transcriptional regulator [Microscillaceae bacterium]